VRVPSARAVEVMLPVVGALACAHDQGIVHRDLKPENVMLTRAGVVKVLDFGVAKLVATQDPGRLEDALVADSSSLAGTRPYMSPEEAMLGLIDPRADIWAVGIMLFELIAGAHPAAGAARGSAGEDDAVLPSASERFPDIGTLGPVIDRCLIRNPEHRTPSARVLLDELEALVSRPPPALKADDASPFAGLAAFQEADATRFFGRGRDIAHVVAELRARPLVALVGPSGAGKSSLARAGVIPALKRSGEGWDAPILRPIDRWRTLARWLDDHRDDAAMLARLRVAARDWEGSGRAAGLLWTGEIAQQASRWRQRGRGELPAVEQRYLAAVIAAAERARRLRRVWLRCSSLREEHAAEILAARQLAFGAAARVRLQRRDAPLVVHRGLQRRARVGHRR
jgi:hypothetical protein